MTTSKSQVNFEQLLSKISAKSLRKSNQKVCIHCLKPR